MSPDRSDGDTRPRRQFQHRRPVCPFISSTYEDFQAERDVLVERVFPAVDALCQQRGTHCAPMDLRWTMEEAQAASGSVLQLALDSVTRCCPFFVSLLGERYGPHRPQNAGPLPPHPDDLPPDAAWLDRALVTAAAGGHDWLLQDVYRHYSVMELQVVQATQLAEADHAYFYFRQPDHVDELLAGLGEVERQARLAVYDAEDEYSRLKVRDLKARVVKRGLSVKYFRTPEELATLVLEDWTALIDRLYPPLERDLGNADSEQFAECVAHETLAETRRATFWRSSTSEGMVAELTEFAAQCLETPPCEDEYMGERETFKQCRRARRSEDEVCEPGVLAVLGDRGSGKTALLATWAREFAADYPDVHVMAHHVGSTALSADVGALLRRVIHDVHGPRLAGMVADLSGDPSDGGLYSLTETFRAALAVRPCVLVIDGIDKLSASYSLSPQKLKTLGWLPLPLPPTCRVVVSTVRSDVTYSALRARRDVRVTRLPPLYPAARAEVLDEHLSAHGTSVSPTHVERIVQCKLADRPLFLAVLAHELRRFAARPAHLDTALQSYLETSSIRDLWGRILQHWVDDFSWPVYNPLAAEDEGQGKAGYCGWVADALRLIAVSRNGLTQTEVLAVLGRLGYDGARRVTPYVWAHFRAAVGGALFERPGGLLSFFHQHLKEAVEYTLLGAVTPDVVAMRDPKAKNGVVSGGAKTLLAPYAGAPFTEPSGSESGQKTFHQHLASYFMTRPHSPRRTDELPWQLEMCSNMEQLCHVLSEPDLFLDLYGDGVTCQSRRLDLFHYWRVLVRAGHDPSPTYRQLVRRAMTPSHTPTVQMLGENEGIKESDETEAVIRPGSSKETLSDVNVSQSTEPHSEHHKARLCHIVAMFLAHVNCLSDAEDLLIMAHNKLYENYPLGESAQDLLCSVEEELGDISCRQQSLESGWKWYSKASRSVDSLMEGIEDEDAMKKLTKRKGRILNQLGNLKISRRQLGKGEGLLRLAEQCMTKADDVVGKARVQHRLGVLRLALSHFVEAEMLFRQAITTREGLFGKSHPAVAEVLDDLASLLCHPENKISYEQFEAEALFKRALRIRETCLGPDHLLVAATLFHLGKLLKAEGNTRDKAECLHLLRRSLDIHTTKLGADHPDTTAVRRVISNLEATTKTRPQLPSGRAGRHTTMTWHDAELLMFQQQERSKAADAARLQAQAPRAAPSPGDSGCSRAVQSVGAGDEREALSTQRYGGSTESGLHFGDSRHTANKSLSMGDLSTFSEGDPTIQVSEQHVQDYAQGTPDPGRKPSKPRPLSSYGKRKGALTQVKFTEHHPALKMVQPVPKAASSEYLDSYAPSPLLSGTKHVKPVQTKLVLKIARPRTDPNKLYKRYAHSTGSTTDSSQGPADSRVTLCHTVSLAPTSRTRPGTTLYHLRRLTPAPHTYSSTQGPNSSLTSLLGARPAPRDVFLHVHHTSAWYHVPGRYSTADQPFPPKRSQRRYGSMAGGARPEAAPIAIDDHFSQHSWDSRAALSVGGADDTGMVDSWMT